MRISLDPAVTARRAGRRPAVRRLTLAGVACVAACAAAWAGGCAGRRRPGTTQSAPTVAYGPVTVVAENRGTYEAVVFAVRGSFRQRVGSVPGLSSVRLAVPAAFTREPAPFALLVTQISGSARYTTDNVIGRQDLQIILTLAPRLAASSYALQ